jgi:hypothetical protein
MASTSNMSTELPPGWEEKYDNFNKLREGAYKQVDKGIKAEEQSRHQEVCM